MPNTDLLLISIIGKTGKFQWFVIIMLYIHRLWIVWHQLLLVIVSPAVGNFTCSNSDLEPCDKNCLQHDFDHSIWERTIVHEWDLVCARRWIPSTIQMFVMFGILVGSIVFGYLADRYGRIKSLYGACILQLVAGVVTVFAKNIYVYTLLRFLTTIGTGGTVVPSFALLMEFTDEEYRTQVACIFMIPGTLAQAALGVLGYYERTWTGIQLIVSISSAILLLYIFLPESPRWLITQRKTSLCVKTLKRGAKCNNRPTDNIEAIVTDFINKMPVVTNVTVKASDLMATKRMKYKTIVMSVNWTINTLEFYAIAQFIGLIGGNIFVNLILGGLIQIPAIFFIIWSLENIGRKKSLILGHILIIISLGAVCVLPTDPTWPITLMTCVAMSGASMNHAILYIYAAELFPTVLRSSGMGICSMFARVGSMVGPFIMQLKEIKFIIPPFICASLPVVAIAMSINLPETKGVDIPDTIEEANSI